MRSQIVLKWFIRPWGGNIRMDERIKQRWARSHGAWRGLQAYFNLATRIDKYVQSLARVQDAECTAHLRVTQECLSCLNASEWPTSRHGLRFSSKPGSSSSVMAIGCHLIQHSKLTNAVLRKKLITSIEHTTFTYTDSKNLSILLHKFPLNGKRRLH